MGRNHLFFERPLVLLATSVTLRMQFGRPGDSDASQARELSAL